MTGSAAAACVVGIDIGGTRIKTVALDRAGVVVAELTRPTPPRLAAEPESVVADLLVEVRGRPAVAGSIQAVGVVVPGLVDEQSGTGIYSANLGWRDLPLRARLLDALDLPVAVGHDVRAGLLAEHRLGAAVGRDDVVFVPIGTGIAAAALSRGLALSHPWAGEIGHVVVEADGPLCGCGGRGCLEAVSSAAAIGRRYAELLAQSAESPTGTPGTATSTTGTATSTTGFGEGESREQGAPADGEQVATALAAGDPLAAQVWQHAVAKLAGALAPVVGTLGTDLVLVGGGLVRSGDLLLEPLRAELARLLPLRAEAPVEVRAAALGDRAGSLGAACLALDLLAGAGR